MGLPTREQASRFFDELEAASRVSRQAAAGSPGPSPWGDDHWDGPTGIVIHYTAGGSFRGSVDWLTRPSWQAKASAHVVIGRGREAWADAGVNRGGLVDALPASVVQLRTVSQTAWHTTWGNAWALGCELACVGEVRSDTQGNLFGPNDNWAEKFTDRASLIQSGGRQWQNYTMPQMMTLFQICQYYRALYPAIKRENVVGHEHAQGVRTPERVGCDKKDAGIFVDYGMARDIIMGAKPAGAYALRPRQKDDGRAPVDSLIASLNGAAHLSAAQLDKEGAYALASLGCDIRDPIGGARYLDGSIAGNARSLYIFQRMMGLTADSKLGPKTAAALAWRLQDRWCV